MSGVRRRGTARRGRPHDRFPLISLAIPLGLVGLAQEWSVGGALLALPWAWAQLFWLVAAAAWVGVIAAHGHRGARAHQSLADQLGHLAQGPLASLVPIAGMLLGADLHGIAPVAGTVLTLVSLAVAAAFAAWMLGFWMRGALPLESVHGGYFLPISAAGLVGALTTAQIGLRDLAIGAFAVGAFFWVVISVVLLLRLAVRPALPAPLTPTLAVMTAPPAVGAAAWSTITGGHPDGLFDALTGMTVFMLLTQIALAPRYRALPFTLGHWGFVFPAATVGALAIRWLGLTHPVAWQGAVIAILAVMTAFVAVVAARSVLGVVSSRLRPGW